MNQSKPCPDNNQATTDFNDEVRAWVEGKNVSSLGFTFEDAASEKPHHFAKAMCYQHDHDIAAFGTN